MREFQTLYQENHGRIYRYAYESVKNHEEAEDLTSDIFFKAVRGVKYERGRKVTRLWLVQVARTTIADYWRARPRVAIYSLEALAEAGWEGPAEASATSSSTLVDRIQRILQALPQHYRDVLTCRFLLSLSIRETAFRMGVTEGNVKVLQFRALKRAAAVEPGITGEQRHSSLSGEDEQRSEDDLE